MTLVEKQCFPLLTDAGDLHYVYTADAPPAYQREPLRKRGKPKEQWWNDGDNEARARMTGSLNGGETQRAKALVKVREGMERLGEQANRYFSRALTTGEPVTMRGKWRFEWRCDCGQTGTVPCTDWIRRGANFGTQCQTCSRKRFGSGSSLGSTKARAA